MAERIPLIYNPNADQIQEVALEDSASVGIMSAQTLATPAFVDRAISMGSTFFNYANFGPVYIAPGGSLTVGAGVSHVII